MRKFFTLIILTIMGWGVVFAQTPDVPQGTVCEFPTVLDSLTGETPVCPVLGTPAVNLSEVSADRLVFTAPILAGEIIDGMQTLFTVKVNGVQGVFYTNASLNGDQTGMVGEVAIVGDSALQGLNLNGKTIHVTAKISGCHAEGSDDPTSSVGVSSESVAFTVPLPCPAFYDTKDSVSGTTYRMLSHIQLDNTYQYQNMLFVVKESGDSVTVSASYNSNFEFRSIGFPINNSFLWAGKTITFYPVLDLKCGSNMDNFVKIIGPSFTRSFLQCPELGSISLHSNGLPDPIQRKDTLFVGVSNYSTALVNGVGVTVTPQGSSSSVYWTLDQWTPDHSAAYKILTLAQLQQLGLSTANLTVSVTANLTVNTNTEACNNASASGQVVLQGLPECPDFDASTTTVVTQQTNGSIVVTTPIAHYNPGLIYHTGVAGQDSLYYTLYRNTADTSQPGALLGMRDAVYDALSQSLTYTIPLSELVPGARYDFVPHANLSGFCNSVSDDYVTIGGPAGYIVVPINCPSYSPTTLAVRNTDGSVTVTHQIVDYNPVMVNSQNMPRVYACDTNMTVFKTSTNVIIDASGLLTCTFQASDLASRPSHNVFFRPRIYLSNTYCSTQPGTGPASNQVCLPYTNLPSFTAVSNTSGVGKVTLFTNEGVILKAKVTGSGAFAINQVAQAGFLISRSPITGYSADKAVVGTLGGTTGDTLSYKVCMDSCGGTIYYRPYLIMKGCDPQIVLGTQKSFSMWSPTFTVSANPTTVAAGGSVALNAVATMTVGTWNQPTSYGIPCQEIGSFANNCGLNYTDDCSTTKTMEVWMYLLVGLRNCTSFWTSFHSIIENAIGMDPGIADFQYRWERNGVQFFSTTSSSTPGSTTDSPTATTVYTGIADFSYNGVHCVQKKNVTVTVP